MVCVYCESPTKVTNSRLQRRQNNIWRRRQCSVCSSIFTTREYAELETALMVEDSTKRLTPFSRDKLFITVYESCKHRPDAVLDAGGIVQTIIKHIIDNQKDGVVQRRDIVLAALKVLGRFDQTAAAVYAAYHPV